MRVYPGTPLFYVTLALCAIIAVQSSVIRQKNVEIERTRRMMVPPPYVVSQDEYNDMVTLLKDISEDWNERYK